jgi:predicted CXXCH cytochrome family protein
VTLRLVAIIICTVLLYSTCSLALAAENDEKAGGVPLPDIPEARGEACVADTDFMRRNHMDMLKHQRDETMLKGLREERYSLKECLDCHAVHGPDLKPVTASDPRHFCRSCHDYAAVSIDCFQCHASRPDSPDSFAGQAPVNTFPDTAIVNGSH